MPAQADIELAWATGELAYKLCDDTPREQMSVYREFAESTARIFVFDIGRQFGKTTISFTHWASMALKMEKARFPFVAQTWEQIKEFAIPVMDWLCLDAPEAFRPVLIKSEGVYVFPSTGSRIPLVGMDVNPGGARGSALDGGTVDEAGFFHNLDQVMGILVPQMLSRPHARLILQSTPSETPAHLWSSKYVPEAMAEGRCATRTLDDNSRATPQLKLELMNAVGGPASTRARREFYAEHITEASMAIVPEFRDAAEHVVKEVERPSHFHTYVAGDVGYTDLTVILYAYFHFDIAKIVIEDESVLQRTTSDVIEGSVEAKEKELGYVGSRTPVKRGIDAPEITIADLRKARLSWGPDDVDEFGKSVPGISRAWQLVPKDDADAALNVVRVDIGKHRILIHPRCRTLITHLKMGVWNKQRTSFQRSDADGIGHFDAIDALKYLVRIVNPKRNPYPSLPAGFKKETHFIRKGHPHAGGLAAMTRGRWRR